MDHNNIIECGGFYFIHNFDSGNLGHVERVPTELIVPSIVNTKTNATETPDYEFNMWTRPDCAGTEFENGNRTWFYFGVQASEPNVLVRLNLINLNKQGKMYNQGMAPVTRTLPGKPQWERIRDRPVHSTDDNTFTLSFKYRTSDNVKATTFFAFTYPFSFAELQITLNSIDLKMLPLPPPQSSDDIYYCRECLVYSLEGRRVDLLTVTSHHGITQEREDRLKNLFPDNQERAFKFANKKIIFISARVHPGETPSSFVFNGFLNLILNRHDPIAIQLRRIYVFKMIPFLNPDGVARGHYRTDTRGVNLNRVYLNPSFALHPTVYASRALIRYYHFGCEKEDLLDDTKSYTSKSIANISESQELLDTKKKKAPKEPSKADKKPAKLGAVKHAKQPVEGKRDSKGMSPEAANLTEQVYDMSLHEMPSQTSENSSKSSENLDPSPSLLNENTLRSCLGSTVHLSTSEELNFQGSNPLRPLRDALKNSISLLMESSSSVAGDSAMSEKDSRLTNVKMGWCAECRAAAKRLSESMSTQPLTATTLRAEVDIGKTYESIEEYREVQKRQLDEQAAKSSQAAVEAEALAAALAKADEEQPTTSGVYFCTNCFKRYKTTGDDDTEEIIKPSECMSSEIVCQSLLSVGDGVPETEPPSPAAVSTRAARKAQHTGDNVQPPPAKEDRPRPSTGLGPKRKKAPPPPLLRPQPKEHDGNLYLYIDLHGHASKKGIFMYGNHFEDLENSVECMLLPRIMSLNNMHFHFSSCNFTERNMYLKDRRDGMSREGSGRVAVLKATGLVRSYTLECNYNTGRLVNVLPPPVKDSPAPPANQPPTPPKYTPHIYEEERKRVPIFRTMNLEVFEEIDPYEVGRSLGASILDLTGQHPNSRIPSSEHRNLTALRDWLRAHSKTSRPQLNMSRIRPKTASPSRMPLYARSKPKVTEERKENTYVGAKTDTERKRNPPVLNQRSQHEIIAMNMKFLKKNEPVKTSSSRTKYLAENEPKPKTMNAKRRSVLAIRKPNASKTQVGGVVKAKVSRRSADDTESPRPVQAKLSKRSFSRSVRGNIKANICRAMASSSSEDMLGGWEDVQGGTILGSQSGMSHAESLTLASKRRTFNAQAPSHLKKIRLKTAM